MQEYKWGPTKMEKQHPENPEWGPGGYYRNRDVEELVRGLRLAIELGIGALRGPLGAEKKLQAIKRMEKVMALTVAEP